MEELPMGGINHQPCNRPKTEYLRWSVVMSREVSLATAAFALANVCLEDVLLREMSNPADAGTIGDAMARLREFESHQHKVQLAIRLLRKNMQESGYEDLHKLCGLNPVRLAFDLRKIAANDQILPIAGMIGKQGFYGVLDMLEHLLEESRQNTTGLERKFAKLQSFESNSGVTDVLERNLPENVRADFAKLFHQWCYFQEVMLASSLISTETWYHWIRAGSLTTGGQPASEVA